MDGAVRVGAQELAVEDDQLAVAGIERAEAEIAAAAQLGEADVAVVSSVQERGEGGGLKQLVIARFGPAVFVAERLDVERSDQPLVDGHQTAAAG
jgi:hypothetical protein